MGDDMKNKRKKDLFDRICDYLDWDDSKNFFFSLVKIIIGFIIGFLLCLIMCTTAVGLLKNRMYKDVQEEYKAMLGTTSEEGEQSLSQISTKMEMLQGYIDQYFLYEEDYAAVAESVYKGMLNGLDDPYSHYYTQEEYAALMESSSGTYCGIGATVTKDEETGYVRVVSMFEGSGALESGVQVDDLITEISGTDIADMDVSSAAALMKGEEGTTVDITIYRPSTGETLSFTIKRHQIDIDTVVSQMLDNHIGYILITEFDGVTAKQFKKALEELEAQGMEGLIVDLRDNPGGLLTSVNSILDMLLPEGLITYTEDKYGNRETYTSDADWNDVPMAVLVNGSSASASEVFAGAMKDYERAMLVGTQTFGKGIVQTIRQLPDGSAIKLTIARYYTPNGICIHGEGITPDIVLEYDSEAVKELETVTWKDDNQLMAGYKALLDKIGQ